MPVKTVMPKVNHVDTEVFAGVDMWHTLPLDIKLSLSVSIFKTKLKTHLYWQCYVTN